MRTLLVASLLAFTALAGCADDPKTIVELTVTETIPVDFGGMSGGVSESAAVALASLYEEQAYATNVGSLRCGALNLDASGITVRSLQVGAGATVLSYSVEVAPAGSTSWTPLGTYNGSVVALQSVAMSDPAFTVDPAGLALISQLVLSDVPTMAVQVHAQVPGDLDGMEVALALVLDFSSEAGACQTSTTGG